MCGAVIVGALLASSLPVTAALTTEACLAKKVKEWGKLRYCQAKENGKTLQAKPSDLAKCQTKFDLKLAKLNELATAAAVACRYGVNGDGTTTDYDTGLQWERKTEDGSVHHWQNPYTWSAMNENGEYTDPTGTIYTDFLARLNNCKSEDSVTPWGGFAGYCDWRLPTLFELVMIVDTTVTGCGSGDSPCIDQAALGTTSVSDYWSSTSGGEESGHDTGFGIPNAWSVNFSDGSPVHLAKGADVFARAVRRRW
jgi:hypothetical protein